MFREGQNLLCIWEIDDCKENQIYSLKKDSEERLYIGGNEDDGICLAYYEDYQSFNYLYGKPSYHYFAIKFEREKAVTNLEKYYPMVRLKNIYLDIEEQVTIFCIYNKSDGNFVPVRDNDYIIMDNSGNYHVFKKEDLIK